jgi:spore coat polysaccharide biosynthesis predicted glycosyltransferase SpsG
MKLDTSNFTPQIGIVVNAGPRIGYGHAVRCLRLARALAVDAPITFYPLSEDCRDFLMSGNTDSKFEILELNSAINDLPSVVITDLREPHGITETIHRSGSRHISIHDLGLGQCCSDVVIDGSITRLFPYAPDKSRAFFMGPQYMITRDTVPRERSSDTVLITFGGGSSAKFAYAVSEEVWKMGLSPVTTGGFIGSSPMTDADFADAMATCRFAISGSGGSLYDLLAAGVPTMVVAFDRIQLRTADAFHERGAVMSAGLMERLSASALERCCAEMLENRARTQQLSETGQLLVDGKGLSRVVEIVRRQLWLTRQVETFSAC